MVFYQSWSGTNRYSGQSDTEESVWGDVEFGPQSAEESVSGSALDFCLVVTQRRNLEDTSLEVFGSAAVEWMKIAQVLPDPPRMDLSTLIRNCQLLTNRWLLGLVVVLVQ